LAEPCGMGTIHPRPTRAERVQSRLRPMLAGPCGLGHCQVGRVVREVPLKGLAGIDFGRQYKDQSITKLSKLMVAVSV